MPAGIVFGVNDGILQRVIHKVSENETVGKLGASLAGFLKENGSGDPAVDLIVIGCSLALGMIAVGILALLFAGRGRSPDVSGITREIESLKKKLGEFTMSANANASEQITQFEFLKQELVMIREELFQAREKLDIMAPNESRHAANMGVGNLLNSPRKTNYAAELDAKLSGRRI